MSCIKQTHELRKDQTWCGKSASGIWCFQNIDHLVNTAQFHGSMVPVCPHCLKQVLLVILSDVKLVPFNGGSSERATSIHVVNDEVQVVID